MKTLFIILLLNIACFSCSITAKAQGNLQFNRALLIEISLTTPSSGSVTAISTQQTITVPAGKVWKIESATGDYKTTATNPSYGQGVQLLLNGKLIFDGVSSTSVATILPMWLAAGTYTLTLQYPSFGYNYLAMGSISGIEFNITQ